MQRTPCGPPCGKQVQYQTKANVTQNIKGLNSICGLTATSTPSDMTVGYLSNRLNTQLRPSTSSPHETISPINPPIQVRSRFSHNTWFNNCFRLAPNAFRIPISARRSSIRLDIMPLRLMAGTSNNAKSAPPYSLMTDAQSISFVLPSLNHVCQYGSG